MTTEAKVGAFTLVGLALFAGVLIMLSGFKLGGDKGYTLYAGFRQVIGVQPQSTVRLSGVPVGEVKDIKNDGRGVTVTMHINGDAKIPKGSQVTVGSAGVMGEKFINIVPMDTSKGWVEDGDYLIGQEEEGMDAMFGNLAKLVDQAQGLIADMHNILGNPDFQQSIVMMAVNMRDTTAHINGMMAAFENMAQANQGNINQMLGNMNAMTSSLNRTANTVEAMMTNLATVGADPQTAENLRLTLNNIAEASDKIRVIAEGLAKVAGDEKTIEDTKAIIHNTRELTEKAGKMKQQLESIKVTPEVDVLYSGAKDKWSTDFNVNVGAAEGPFLSFGMDNIGSSGRGNFQAGTRFGNFGARGGVIYGEAGVGVDAYAGDKFKFSADVYDVHDPSVRLRAQYRLGNSDTWLLGQMNDVNDSDHRATFVGIRQSF
ncbi:phospholipid/cholesterol/gamma-HCH transport system substrate-binding protein [Selenomonas sp. GACV-9]|nr:phospholipid/cholesterol/gamma-HCH transport system substrate-binding protein [Selenomonas ruminantium]